MQNSRFLQVHPDAIIEYIWNDENFFEDEYSIIKDIKNNISSFTFSSNANEPDNYNKIPYQLYLVDQLTNKFGIVNPENKQFLQESKYVNNQPSLFDKIKIWFPLNYTFPNSSGFYINVSALNYDGTTKYNLSNFYLDITDNQQFNKIQNEINPFRLNERLWGKSITLYIPSVSFESQNRVNNQPQLGTINYNLTEGNSGLSQILPVYIDFRLIFNKQIVLGETIYTLTPSNILSLPQSPEYSNLGVSITEATDGDYFLINGTYNGTIGAFDSFMTTLEQSGLSSYILYNITIYEENLPQDTIQFYVYQDYFKQISFRPILKFTNTTATIRVDMQLIRITDSLTITKSTEIALIGNTIAKYGKYATPINISGAIKPKLYNSKPDTLVMPANDLLNSYLKRRTAKTINTDIKYIPYPILTDVFNIVCQDSTIQNKTNKYFGFGELELIFTPFDNIFKLKVSKQVDANNTTAFKFPTTNSVIQLVFKAAINELRIPLYFESNEVDLNNGVLVFRISNLDYSILKTIYSINNKFYITMTSNGIETSVYNGIFNLLENLTSVSSNVINSEGNITAPVLIPTNNVATTTLKTPATQLSLMGETVKAVAVNATAAPLASPMLNAMSSISLSSVQLARLG